jgi:hypothetical protein
MKARALSVTHVVESGLTAFNDMGAVVGGQRRCRLEAVFEYSSVWLLQQDVLGLVVSARLLRRDEVPQSGRRHERNCGCSFCAEPVEAER